MGAKPPEVFIALPWKNEVNHYLCRKTTAMLKIERLIFNPFQENTYVVSDETGECVIIDAGNHTSREEAVLTDLLQNNGLEPVMAINTHGHVDHLLGVSYVKERFGVPFALHGADRFLLESAMQHAMLYGFDLQQVPAVEIDLAAAPAVTFGETVLKVIHTPGHSPGHLCFYNEKEKILFTGDTLFKESIGRTDLPGGDYDQIMRSILERIVPLGGEVTFYPGHGSSSTIGHELIYNPFIAEVLHGEVG